ncbi:MAG: MFS transporter [Sandaracinaceae bacterium]|nr:MFS transporter [Sandaracinaceae bacterium]
MRATSYLLFGAGQLGVMMLARFFFQWVLDFAGTPTAAGVPLFAAASVGLLFFAFRIFDGVTDPLAGLLGDGWVRRGRERRSLLFVAFALPSIGLVLVFSPSEALGEAARWGLLAAGMFVFFVGYTLYAIPYWSLLDDYAAGDEARRARLSSVLGGGVLGATALGFVLSPWLVERLGFLGAAAVFAAPAAGLMLLPYVARPDDARAPAPSPPGPGLVATLREALAHRRFVSVVVLFAGGQMSFTVMTAAAPFFAVDLLGGETSDVALLLGPFLLTAIPTFLVLPRLSRRLGWERAVLGATLALGAVYGGAGLLGADLIGGPVVTAALLFAMGGPMAAVLLGLEGEAIVASAAERDGEVTSLYFGAFNFVVKGLNGLALYLTGILAGLARGGEPLAVRAMGGLAGGLLVVGVIAYVALRPARVRR